MPNLSSLFPAPLHGRLAPPGGPDGRNVPTQFPIASSTYGGFSDRGQVTIPKRSCSKHALGDTLVATPRTGYAGTMAALEQEAIAEVIRTRAGDHIGTQELVGSVELG